MRRLMTLTLLALASVGVAKSPAAVLAARESAVQIIQREVVDGKVAYDAVCSGAVVQLEAGARIVSAGHCLEDAPNGDYLAYDMAGRLWTMHLEGRENEWPKAD